MTATEPAAPEPMTAEEQHELNKEKIRRLMDGGTRKELTEAEVEQCILEDYRLLHPDTSDEDLHALHQRERRAFVRADAITVLAADLIRTKRLADYLGDKLRRLEMKIIEKGPPR